MKRNALFLVGLVLAVGLIAAGCGSDDSNDDSTTSSTPTGTEASTELSKADFVQQGNAICQEGNAAIAQAGEAAGQPGTPEFDAFVTDTVIPSVQGQIDDIRALGIPADDADEVNGILDEAQTDLDGVKADPSQLQGEPFAEVNAKLKAYGLTDCAN
jgi:hypothetical protein